ncbi:hypothetical protein [Cellvibrio japonicus]|uniref:Putative lipoprotein n=1 Tax=Cellvibrio japonicus (strain Ueda107) TaxID=498211 RepID=B3PF87_CELJU|nr:hypothetical protein [Cellvibrio japonicus]ACE85270.1 putative lipoprotein [Cellvibrio japonicus Ueda107]QEI13637.1 hypothetical protein FY117_16420 [Cellvibrio japonicus]QEI17210.1 hypothetical protein FY116_16420 [Cellvibrio japonicus]QEI20788.1 hypothetical protein FY115_16420 [Cellvibrio japonicus]
MPRFFTPHITPYRVLFMSLTLSACGGIDYEEKKATATPPIQTSTSESSAELSAVSTLSSSSSSLTLLGTGTINRSSSSSIPDVWSSNSVSSPASSYATSQVAIIQPGAPVSSAPQSSSIPGNTSSLSNPVSSASSVFFYSSSSANSNAAKEAVPSSQASLSSTSSDAVNPLLSWIPPNARENGEYLDAYEIGGYEIRYKSPENDTYTYIRLPSDQTEYPVDTLPPGTEIDIATYDIHGLYSEFIKIK